MAKRQPRAARTAADAPVRARSRSPHPRSDVDVATEAATPARTASAPMRLAAEVERLRAELAAARARVAELEATADVDPLTDILNRRGFTRELTRALAYVKRYGARAVLIYIDLDRFKPVNDAHGHAAGDAVLKAVVATLQRHVRASDTVARLGGDELGLLLWNLDEAAAAAKAAALEAVVAATPIPWGTTSLTVGASAGFAVLSPHDAVADVLARADRAMYARKAARGR
jgi:diguanylate cyclase (GGDEF)-like protein